MIAARKFQSESVLREADTGSFDCVGVGFADANFAQDDKT